MSSLILVEGIDIDFLHKCALEDCTEQHQFSTAPDIVKVWPDSLLKLGTLRIGMVEIMFMLFVLGDGSVADDIWWHSSSCPSAACLGPAEAHSAAGRIQPCDQEDRQHGSAVGCVQVHFNHAEEPQPLREYCKRTQRRRLLGMIAFGLCLKVFILNTATLVYSNYSKDVYLRASFICDQFFWRGEPTGM